MQGMCLGEASVSGCFWEEKEPHTQDCLLLLETSFVIPLSWMAL